MTEHDLIRLLVDALRDIRFGYDCTEALAAADAWSKEQEICSCGDGPSRGEPIVDGKCWVCRSVPKQTSIPPEETLAEFIQRRAPEIRKDQSWQRGSVMPQGPVMHAAECKHIWHEHQDLSMNLVCPCCGASKAEVK